MIHPGRPTYNLLVKSAEAYFQEGNYANAALVADDNSWIKHAALALMAHPQACERLRDFESIEDGRFYRAVGLWIQGQDELALSILSTVQTLHAERLAKELRRSTIPILIQSPWAVRNMVLYPARHDKKFRVSGIGPMEHARQSSVYSSIFEYFDRQQPPLFFYSLMIEWQHLPQELSRAPFICVGRTSDYDIHIQALLPLLNTCDAILTHDGTEMENLQPLIQRPIFTVPKSLGSTSVLPPTPESTEREYDLLLSGTVLNTYHPDKAHLVRMMLEKKDLRIKFVNRFLTDDQYFKNLAKSRLSVSYVRWTGGWTTRALESFAMGCYTLVQKGSILTLYFDEKDGLGTYDFAEGDLPERMTEAVKNWDHYSQLVMNGARRVRSEWTSIRCTSQNLRFLTFLATDPKIKKAPAPDVEPIQKRNILFQGWVYPSNHFHRELFVRNFDRCYRALGRVPTTHDLINLLRETIMMHAAHRLSCFGFDVNPWRMKEVFDLCVQGFEIFPRCLVLRLVYCKAACHNGSPQEIEQGLREIQQTLLKPMSDWDVDPMEDVFPWDYAPEMFDYRSYFDLVCRIKSGQESESYSLHTLIYGSLYRYLAAYSGDVGHLRRACELCPAFAPYSLALATQLMTDSGAANVQEAASILEKLSENSVVMPRAISGLRLLADAGLYASPRLEELESSLMVLDQDASERRLDAETPLPLRPALAAF